MDKPVLQIIIGSTRPGRIGASIAQWTAERAIAFGAFDVEVVDLAEVNLPMLDEPHHPRLQNYVHEHTKRWSATVSRADAFIFVIPEYNHGFNAATKNALDYLYNEWKDKPVGLVSYGGVSGGTRAVEMLKPVLEAFQMVPLLESVNIQFASKHVDSGRFQSEGAHEKSASAMLDDLARWTSTLRPLREPESVEVAS